MPIFPWWGSFFSLSIDCCFQNENWTIKKKKRNLKISSINIILFDNNNGKIYFATEREEGTHRKRERKEWKVGIFGWSIFIFCRQMAFRSLCWRRPWCFSSLTHKKKKHLHRRRRCHHHNLPKIHWNLL